jgi:hypothetical protein
LAKIEAMTQELTDQINAAFKAQDRFSRSDLLDFIAHVRPGLKPSTRRWLVYDLVRKNRLMQLNKDTFSLQQKPAYRPRLTEYMMKIATLTGNTFPDASWCIWSTLWFNEFSVHQFSKDTIVVEIEKDLASSLFYFLKEQPLENVLLKPDTQTLTLYSTSPSVAVNHLITRTPLQLEKHEGQTVPVPGLEKLLTDLYCNEPLLDHIQAAGKEHILIAAFNKYALNVTAMLSYARRRGQRQKLVNVIRSLIPDIKHMLDNDLP